jgi:FkbM family methyltransferase
MQVWFDTQLVNLRIGTPDFSVANTCLNGEFAEVIAAAAEAPDGLIIDAGSYIGTAAIAFARAFPRSTIVALEPSGANFQLLKRNIKDFDNIVPLNKGLGPERGTTSLYDPGTGEWGFTLIGNDLDLRSQKIGTVELITIDDILSMFDERNIKILKIDIEGAEEALLNGNIHWINRTLVFCAELHDRISPGCSGAFEKATRGRFNRQLDGEKIMSLIRSSPILPS